MSTALDSAPPRRRRRRRLRRRCAGIQKGAVLLVALGEERAAEIFKHLSQTEVEALSLEIAKAPQGRRPTSATTSCTEAVETVLRRGLRRRGRRRLRPRAAREVARRATRAEEIIARLAATIERRPFEFLRRTPPEQIHVFLRNESPQTIALVVANLHTDARRPGARRCCRPRSRPRSPCASRTMGETRPEVVAQVEAVMKQKLSNVIAAGVLRRRRRQVARRHPQPRRPPDRAQRARPARRRPTRELAEEVRLLLFTFEDIVKLDDRSIQMVLKEVDQKDLAIALRGVSDEVQRPDLRATCPSAAPSCSARRSSSSRRSAGASSRRRRAASSASCAASRRPARS